MMQSMTLSDRLVIAGMALVAAGAMAVGWAIRLVATGVDEAIGFVDRRTHA